jgi:hypothetical protein
MLHRGNRKEGITHAEAWTRIVDTNAKGKYWEAVAFRSHIAFINNRLLPGVLKDVGDLDFIESEGGYLPS